jgi:hypothetical protein
MLARTLTRQLDTPATAAERSRRTMRPPRGGRIDATDTRDRTVNRSEQ